MSIFIQILCVSLIEKRKEFLKKVKDCKINRTYLYNII